ncbi:MAG: four helix bundle protein [Nitrospirota bacterium]
MQFNQVEELRIFQAAEMLGDQVWSEVLRWKPFARETIGIQLVKSVDSIGANIAEGYGRHHPKDVVNFLYMARGSGQEAKFWLRRAGSRKLIAEGLLAKLMDDMEILSKQMNAFIRAKRAQRTTK